MKLYEKIKIIRKARGMSQEELGFKLQNRNSNGISRQTISDWENERCEPVLDNIRNLCDVLDVSFDTLLDDTVDLNDKNVLNCALKHLGDDTKGKINNSHRYHIYAYTVTKKDYAKVISYFALLAVSILFIIVGLCFSRIGLSVGRMAHVGGFFAVVLLCFVTFPISWIGKMKRGGTFRSFGTLSRTHFVMIDRTDKSFDDTIYVPVSQIESIELDKNATNRHGRVLVHIKGKSKPWVTDDIVDPQQLISEFNKLDIYQQ